MNTKENRQSNLRDLDKARQLFVQGEYSCVLVKGDLVQTSRERGISALLKFIDNENDYTNYAAADKIVGKAAALLYSYMKVGTLYAKVIAEKALQVCNKNGIVTEYEIITPEILSRTGDGRCPMEKIVENIEDPSSAVETLKNALEKMKKP